MGKRQKTKYRKLEFDSKPTHTESSRNAPSKKENMSLQTNLEEVGFTSGTSEVVLDNSRSLGTKELKRNCKTNSVLQKEICRPSIYGSVSSSHITHELNTSNFTPGQSGNTNPVKNRALNKAPMVLECAIPAQQNIAFKVPSADSAAETGNSEFLIQCISKPLNTNCSQFEGYGTNLGENLNVDANEFVPRDASNHSDDSVKSDSRPFSHCQKEKLSSFPLENYESNTKYHQFSSGPSSEKGMEPQDNRRRNQQRRDSSQSRNRTDKTRESQHHYEQFASSQKKSQGPRMDSDRSMTRSQNKNNRTSESKRHERYETNQQDIHGPRRVSDRNVTSKSRERYDDQPGRNRQMEEQPNEDDKRRQQRQDRDFSHKSDSDCQNRTSDSKKSGQQSENTGDKDQSNWDGSESGQRSDINSHPKKQDKTHWGERKSHPREDLDSGNTSVVASQLGRLSHEKKKHLDPRLDREMASGAESSKIHDRSATDEKGERRNSWRTSTGSQRGRPSYEMDKPANPRSERERKFLDADSKIHNRSDGSREYWRTTADSRKSNYFDRSYEKTDEEYRRFKEEYGKNESAEFIKVKEIEQDLFKMPSDFALGHCVAEDMRMGSGIAVQFKRDFKRVGELLNQRQRQGGLAFLEIDKRFVYYLVTKRASSGKPTYETFWMSLKKLRDHIHENHVKHLAIPRIGCGLDRLEWSMVKFMLEFLFRDVDVEITVCNFQQTEDSTPQKEYLSNKIVDETKSLVEMEEYTMILYYASQDGYVSEIMERLDKKFNFLSEFKKLPKKLGEPIKCEKRNYILYGCVVRKTKEALFDFMAFENCLSQVNKNNRKENYPFEYVALEEEYDTKDDFLNERIITMLRVHLRDAYCPASDVNQKPDEPSWIN